MSIAGGAAVQHSGYTFVPPISLIVGAFNKMLIEMSIYFSHV